MTIAELIQKINESVLSDRAKQEIVSLAQGYTEVTQELEDKVKDLIQEDIDRDLAELGAPETSAEIEQAEAQLGTDLDMVEHELATELASVEQDLHEIEDMRSQLAKAEDEYKIAQLRSDLVSGS